MSNLSIFSFVRHPVCKDGSSSSGFRSVVAGDFFPVREIWINPSKPALYYRSSTACIRRSVTSSRARAHSSYSFLRRVFLHLRWHSTVANDALFSDESGHLRASVNRDSFFPDGSRDNERTTYVASDLGHGTEPYAIRHVDRVIYFEILFSFHGAAASRVVVTCERAPSRWWTRRDLNDLAMTSLSLSLSKWLRSCRRSQTFARKLWRCSRDLGNYWH